MSKEAREKFEARTAPASHELRQALAAIERAKSNGYPPHVSACMQAAQAHAIKALKLIERALP